MYCSWKTRGLHGRGHSVLPGPTWTRYGTEIPRAKSVSINAGSACADPELAGTATSSGQLLLAVLGDSAEASVEDTVSRKSDSNLESRPST